MRSLDGAGVVGAASPRVVLGSQCVAVSPAPPAGFALEATGFPIGRFPTLVARHRLPKGDDSLFVVRVGKASGREASLNRRSSWRHWALLVFPCPSAPLHLCLLPTPLTCRFLLRHFNISKYIDYKFNEVSQDPSRLLDCRSKLLWASQYASSDAIQSRWVVFHT